MTEALEKQLPIHQLEEIIADEDIQEGVKPFCSNKKPTV